MGPFFKIDITAIAASDPLLGLFELVFLLLCLAWFRLKAVITPFPIGLLKFISRLKIELNNDEHNKSKWGVLPFITHPRATKPSNLLIFFLIAIGISNAPGIL